MKLLWPFFCILVVCGLCITFGVYLGGGFGNDSANTLSAKDEVISKINKLGLNDLLEVHNVLHESLRVTIGYERAAAQLATKKVEAAEMLLKTELAPDEQKNREALDRIDGGLSTRVIKLAKEVQEKSATTPEKQPN